MPPHSPLCGGGSEKNAAHRSCNSEAALNLISETIGSQNILNSCPLSSQSVQGNICFTKSAGSVQYLLHPPCGVLYNLISFLFKSVLFCSGRFFLFAADLYNYVGDGKTVDITSKNASLPSRWYDIQRNYGTNGFGLSPIPIDTSFTVRFYRTRDKFFWSKSPLKKICGYDKIIL